MLLLIARAVRVTECIRLPFRRLTRYRLCFRFTKCYDNRGQLASFDPTVFALFDFV